jgi:dihydrofolate reductase
MGRLIMWNMVTLDGYFEGLKPWEIDWHVWGDELEALSQEQLNTAEALLFGRATYLGMADYWQKATGETANLMNAISKVVFSKTLNEAIWNNTRLVKTDAAAEVLQLKQKSKNNLLIFGSALLSSTLMKANLIDEYRLGINPIVLGGGNPLFKPGPDRMKMKLIEARPLKMGCVILRYQPERAPSV